MPDEISKGLEGVIAAESKVCFIDGEKGTLLYHGYNINDLAEKSSFEETSYLLLFGKLPSRQELKDFSKKLAAGRQLPKEMIKLMKVYARTATPMDALRTGVSVLADYDTNIKDNSNGKNLERGLDLIAKFPTIVANAYRIQKGEKFVKPKKGFGHAENFLYMLHNQKPEDTAIRALDMDFILHAEHGFNASTFSARVTISTLSDMYAAIVSAIGTLKGPLHGGAAGEVFKMLTQIGTAGNVEAYVNNAMEKKQKFMGFGHRVYKTIDPRATHLKLMSRQLAEKTGNRTFFDVSTKLEDMVVPILKEKKIYPNVDFYSPTVYNNLGIPEDVFDSIFAISRASGWTAHVMEQLADNRIIRPREKYTGPMNLEYVPINKRK